VNSRNWEIGTWPTLCAFGAGGKQKMEDGGWWKLMIFGNNVAGMHGAGSQINSN
jgi:hypothetical protein